jgi:predicted DNA binding CopG/RHH family protein
LTARLHSAIFLPMKVKKLTIRLAESDWRALKIKAINENTDMQKFVFALIINALPLPSNQSTKGKL